MGPSGRVQLADGSWVGQRYANLEEPARAVLTKGGGIEMHILDDRPPTFGYPFRAAPWSPDLSPQGKDGEDALSAVAHRLAGGRKKIWHVLRTEANAARWIEMDPMPPVDAAWLRPLGVATDPSIVAKRPPRYQAILDSLTRLGTRFDADRGFIFSDKGGPLGFATWWLQGEDRYRFWSGSPGTLNFEPLTGAQHLRWLSGGDIFWSSGRTCLHHNWAAIMARTWLETRSEVAWWALCRMSTVANANALCWSGKYRGWDWYEKSGGVGREYRVEPGSYPGAAAQNYNQWTLNHLAVGAIFGDGLGYDWAREGRDAHLAALPAMRYETWNGSYGARIAGLGALNLFDAWRLTEDPALLALAVETLENAIRVSREPARLAAEPDPRYRDLELGVPYWSNPRQPQGQSFNVFGLGYVYWAMAELAARAPLEPATRRLFIRKLAQGAEFIREECVVDFGDLLVPRYIMTADRVPAIYNNGHRRVNGVDSYGAGVSAFTAALLIPVLGFDALVNRDAKSRAMVDRLIDQHGEFADWSVVVNRTTWEGTVLRDQRPGGFAILALSAGCTGVRPGVHCLRIDYVGEEGELGASEVVEILEVLPGGLRVASPTQAAAGAGYAVVGPHEIRNKRDVAIRSLELPRPMQRPDPGRPFNWAHGLHVSNWQKELAMLLRTHDWAAKVR